MTTTRPIDVDGDGVRDAFVPIPSKQGVCPEQFSYRVYVVRGACGHDLGVVGPGNLPAASSLGPRDRSGYRPLVLEQRTSQHGRRLVPEITTTRRRFAVVRGAYRRVGATTTRNGRCHHCAVWYCTQRPTVAAGAPSP